MKRFFTLLLFILFAEIAFGQNISMEIAKKAGLVFLNSRCGQSQKDSSQMQLAYRTESFYVFNAQEAGFVVVSATDKVCPILAYSESGRFDLNSIPPALKEALSRYETEIAYAVEKQILSAEKPENQWKDLLNGKIRTQKSNKVEPLLGEIKWGQGEYYNDSCPYDAAADKKCLTGCAAVAMAQIFKYWQFPQKGTGSNCYDADYAAIYEVCGDYGRLCADFENTTYNYNAMPNQLTATSTSAEKSATAQLLFHCGVSVNMMYGTAGSYSVIIQDDYWLGKDDQAGNPYTDVRTALKKHFGYTLVDTATQNTYGEEWTNLLREQLNDRMPVLMAGGSHMFVCDGYDENDFFHFNWGWDGWSNCYCRITSLIPEPPNDNQNFTAGQKALINIIPPHLNISTLKSENNLVIYPNPTSGQLRIADYELQGRDIAIYDVYGRNIFNFQLSTFNSIDISHLSSGIYFLKIDHKVLRFVKE